MRNSLLVGLVTLACSAACSSPGDEAELSGGSGASAHEDTSKHGFVSARLTSGGGLCDNGNGCKYTVEVAVSRLRFTSIESTVQEVSLEPTDTRDLVGFVESNDLRVAAEAYDAADWADAPAGTSELEVVWDGRAPIVMSPLGRCINCAEPDQHPLRVLSRKLWDLKLKYTGDSR